MNCKKCGNEVASNEVYCQNCGEKLEDVSTGSYNEPSKQTTVEQNPYVNTDTQQQNQNTYYSNNAQNQYGNGQNNQYDYQNPYTNQQQSPQYANNVNSPQAVSNVAAFIISIASIFLCSNLIFGIVGIVYASKISTLNMIGDFEGAKQANKKSIMWSLIGVAVTILLTIIAVIIAVTFFGDIVKNMDFNIQPEPYPNPFN